VASKPPRLHSNLEGGFGAGHASLQLALKVSDNAQAVTITIDFSNLYAAGVAYVSFKLFDIDFSDQGGNNGYQDQIRSISATSTTGTSIAPSITGVGPNVSLSGSGLNQLLTGMVSTSDTGATSADANATITFNTTNIRSITFTYGNTNAFSKPAYQHIALDNIDHSIVPESNNWWVGLFGYGVLIVSSLSHHRKLRPTKKVRRS
jgi:hypothetical protein